MEVMETSHGGSGETGFLSQDLYNFFGAEKGKGKKVQCGIRNEPYALDRRERSRVF
jgi:hypothetical protein